MPQRRAQAGCAAETAARSEGRLLGVVGGVLGLVGAGEVGPQPDHPPRPGPLAGQRRGAHRAGQSASGAAAGQPGVDLELDAGEGVRVAAGGGAPGARRPPGVELGDRVGADVDAAGHGGREVVAGDGQPAQQRAGVAGGAERQRLVEGGDASHSAPASRAARADREQAVAVAVGLDHRHQRHAGGRARSTRDVVPHGREVDHDLARAEVAGPGVMSDHPSTVAGRAQPDPAVSGRSGPEYPPGAPPPGPGARAPRRGR